MNAPGSPIHWQTVPLDAVPPQPWKNGGGTTRELLTWPASDGPHSDWKVRLSVAEVCADGPFSRFEGVQRWFAVLSGDGVRLVVNGRAQALARTSEPFPFDGGADTVCTLLGGATQDFNLMVRGGSAVLRRVRGITSLGGTGLQALYAASRPAVVDGLRVPANTLAWRWGDGPVTVQGDDALWMEVML